MKKIRIALVYSLYVLVLGGFFIYFLFPAETVSRYIVARVASIDPDVHLSIEDVSPILPPGLKLQQVTIDYTGDYRLAVAKIRLYPRWLTLLGRNSAVRYTAATGGGTIRGEASVSAASPRRQIRLDADLSDVRIKELGLRIFDNLRLDGSATGLIRYREDSNRTADIQMTINAMTMTPPRPVMGIRKLQFDTVRAEASLKNSNVKVSKLTFTGEQIGGELTGSIFVDRRLMDSRLSLSGTLQLNLRQQGSPAASLPQMLGGISLAGKVPVVIQGTLANPEVSLR